MIALFIILDILIFALLLVAIFFLVRWIVETSEKERPEIENDMDEFRNEDIYAEGKAQMDRLAHIEDVVLNNPNTERKDGDDG